MLVKISELNNFRPQITKLLINHYHKKIHHHEQQFVINMLTEKYWRLRPAVKGIWSRCYICRNRKVTTNIPLMGQPARVDWNQQSDHSLRRGLFWTIDQAKS